MIQFLLVNDRVPRFKAYCLNCDEVLGSPYIREPQTHLRYCSVACFCTARSDAENAIGGQNVVPQLRTPLRLATPPAPLLLESMQKAP